MKNSKNKIRVFLSILLIGLVIVCWHFKIEPLNKLSLQFNDIKYLFNLHTPSKEIVFVAIDEKSVTKYGRWPWDREFLGKKLLPLQEAKAVAFDMVFSENTVAQKDIALANDIASLDNSICGFFLRNDSTKVFNQEIDDILEESSLNRVFVKTSPFIKFDHAEVNILDISSSCSMNGVFSTLADSDSLFRKYPIAFIYNGLVYPSLGVQTLRYVLNQDITIEQKNTEYSIALDKRKLIIDSNGFLQLNYYKQEGYNVISFADLDDPNFNKALIKDKIVVLGISEAGVSDIRATPLGQVPGPLLHYTFISNYLQDIVLKKYDLLELVLIVIFSIIPIFLSSLIKMLNYRIGTYFLLILLIIGFSIIEYRYYNIWIDMFYILFGHIVLLIFNGVFIFKTKDSETRFVKDAFKNYLSENLLDEIIKNPGKLKLGGEKKEVTIIFTDIRGFTNLSEQVSSEDLIRILEYYFTPMTQLVFKNNGTLDKYIGDAIMAFYNAPIDVIDHEKCAVRTALQMVKELAHINKKLNSMNLPSIDFGAGINTGEAIVGNIGSMNRFDYSVVGDSVNVASRVEGLCKQYKVRIIVSEFTKAKLDDEFLTRELDDVILRGKNESIKIYEVMDASISTNKVIKELYESALKLYRENNLVEAKHLMTECYVTYKDEASHQFIKAKLS